MRTRYAVPALLLTASLTLTGCGSDDSTSGSDDASASASETASPTTEPSASSAPASPSEKPTKKPEPSVQTIAITIEDGTIKPNGERVEAKLGEPIMLKIRADEAGELHVHSTPEQEIAFEEGSSTKKLVIDQPGIVDVEEHSLGQVIVQLQVS